jgi:AcrR family transcriptional regulator
MSLERKRLTRQESRLMTQAMLIDAAEAVFLREGFENASVEQITEAAGFSRGAFYSNFTDKEDLALAVIDKRRRDLAGALRTLQRISDPAEQTAAFRDWFAKQWRQTDWIALRAELSRCAQRNPALEGRLAELCRQEIQTVAQSLPSDGSGQAATALALIAASHGLGSMGFHAAPDLHQLCEAAIRLVFDRVTGGRGAVCTA